MERVLLLGSPGVGKSTFARAVAAKTGLQIIYLDRYYNDASLCYETDIAAWEAMIRVKMQENSWIMDGNYSSTIVERIARADTVILFDYPRWQAFLGLLRRRIEYHTKVRVDMPVGWRERFDLKFFKYVWNYKPKYPTGRLAAAIRVCPPEKLIVFKNPRDAAQYLVRIPDIKKPRR